MKKIKELLLKIKHCTIETLENLWLFIKKHLDVDVNVKKYLKIINFLVLILIYIINTNVYIETITGLWIFSIIAISLYKWFKKN